MSLMVSAAASSKPCDIDHLLRSLAGNRPRARKLAQMFLDIYPGKLALFDEALQATDRVALRRVVHEIRGSCALFSAMTCLTLACKLEDALSDQLESGLLEDCARFKVALADLAEELQLFLDEQPIPLSETAGT